MSNPTIPSPLESAPGPTPTPASSRLDSLDALRGFAMFWIVGADALGRAFRELEAGAVGRFLAWEMEHAPWEGFRFYDLIFPLFLFMVGVAVPFSLDRLVARDGCRAALGRVLRRGVILYLLGLLYYGGMAEGFDRVRFVGVLQRIAVCYVVVSVLHLTVRPRVSAIVGAGLLLGYWALLALVPVPGFGAGDFARGHNLANWIDAHYLPGRVWYGDYDPEGLLGTLPAIVSCLLGLFAAHVLRAPQLSVAQRTQRLVVGGLALLALGYAWGVPFPVIKRIWTSSYVLVAGGWSVLLLALFYLVIDGRGRRAWAQPFIWIGTNALTIYLVSRFVNFDDLAARFFGGEIAATLNALWPGLAGLVLALTGIGLCLALCRFLYVRKIFLRI